MKYIAEVDGLEFPVEILDEKRVRFGNDILEADLTTVSSDSLYSLIVNGESYEAYVYPGEDGWQVLLRGQFYQVRVEDEREKRLHLSQQNSIYRKAEFVLKAPMPGVIVSIPIKEGQTVIKDETMIILESMKMQNELRAPYNGMINKLQIKTGEYVEQKQTLLVLHIIPEIKST